MLNAALRLVLAAFLTAVSLGADTSGWSDWKGIPDGGRDKIQISFKKLPSDPQKGVFVFYYRFQNLYEGTVHLQCAVDFIDGDGRPGLDSGCDADLKPGEIKSSAGWFVYGKEAIGAHMRSKGTPATGGTAPNASSGSSELGHYEPPSVVNFGKYSQMARAVHKSLDSDWWRTYLPGLKTTMPDGAHDSGYLYQYVQSGLQACPDNAVIQKISRVHFVVKNGIITELSHSDESDGIVRCIDSSETKDYPKQQWLEHLPRHGAGGVIG